MKQKGFVGIYILVGLLILGALGGVYFYGKLSVQNPVVQPQISVSPTPQPLKSDETTNWKTYIDNQYNFSFKYPAIWIIQTEGSFSDYGQTARFYNDGEKIDPPYMMKRGNEQMTLDISEQDFDGLKIQTKLSETMIAGKRALTLSEGAYILIDPSNKKILRIFRYPDGEYYMNTILSTFKFN